MESATLVPAVHAEERTFEYRKLSEVAGLLLKVVHVEPRLGNYGPEVMIWAYDGGQQICVTTTAQRLVSLYDSGRFETGFYRFIKSDFPPGWLAKRETNQEQIPF